MAAASAALASPLLGGEDSAKAAKNLQPPPAGPYEPPLGEQVRAFATDALISLTCVVVWVAFPPLPDVANWSLCAAVLVAACAWRWQMRRSVRGSVGDGLPYSCGFIEAAGRQVFLVATVHISPQAPQDVKTVITGQRPDVVLVELDPERQDRLRNSVPPVNEADLQPLTISGLPGADEEAAEVATVEFRAQRAAWNGEHAGERVEGGLVFDEANPHGARPMRAALKGQVAVVYRGGPGFVPFALKVHNAALAGAKAVLVVDTYKNLMPFRFGIGSDVTSNLRIAWMTKNLGFPRLPALLLCKDDGDRLVKALRSFGSEGLRQREGLSAAFRVREDNYPRRQLFRQMWQSFLAWVSGVAVLYCLIQFFGVDVGEEFNAAEQQAAHQEVPCVCIDVDTDRFWKRILEDFAPWPRNLLNAFWSWLALPRVFFRILFPSEGSIDVSGATVLHAKSFKLRIWIAFVVAGFVSSQILTLFCQGNIVAVERTAEDVGVVPKEDRNFVQSLIGNVGYFYLMPQVYSAIVASRDEAMYRGLVARCRQFDARKAVVVVGAGHANGILQRVRSRGL